MSTGNSPCSGLGRAVTIAHARAHALPPPTAAPASRSIPCSYLAFPGALHRACAPAAAARPRASRDYQKRQVLGGDSAMIPHASMHHESIVLCPYVPSRRPLAGAGCGPSYSYLTSE